MLVVEVYSHDAVVNRHRVASDNTVEGNNSAQCCGCGSVIDLVVGCYTTYGQCFGGDISGSAAGCGHRIVAEIGTGERNPGHIDSFCITDIPVFKCCCAVDGQNITGHPIISSGNRCISGAVIDLVHTGVGNVKGAGRDVGSCSPGGYKVVVASINTTKRHTGHIYRLAGPHILIQKGGSAADGKNITPQTVV